MHHVKATKVMVLSGLRIIVSQINREYEETKLIEYVFYQSSNQKYSRENSTKAVTLSRLATTELSRTVLIKPLIKSSAKVEEVL